MKKNNIGVIALALGGVGIAYYLYNQSKKSKRVTDRLNVEPAIDMEKETEESESTPGGEGLIDPSKAKQFVTEKLIPGAKNLLKKAKQKITERRKKRKARVIIEPTESMTKEEFETPITRSSKRAARVERRTARKTARVEKRATRRAKRKSNVSGFDNLSLLN
jgi:hypothetical protein